MSAAILWSVIRRALLVTISALALQLAGGPLLSVVGVVFQYPKFLIEPQALALYLGLIPPVTLILFLTALYRELSGTDSAARRRLFALAAVCGKVVALGLIFWSIHETKVALGSMTPEAREQLIYKLPSLAHYWVHNAVFGMLPTVLWMAFLMIFWRDPAPLDRRHTRALAAVFCIVTAAQALYELGQLISRNQRFYFDWTVHPLTAFWQLVILPTVTLAFSLVLPYLLFTIWRSEPTPDPTEGVAAP